MLRWSCSFAHLASCTTKLLSILGRGLAVLLALPPNSSIYPTCQEQGQYMLRKKSKRLDTSRRSSRVTRSPAFSPNGGALSNKKKSSPSLSSISCRFLPADQHMLFYLEHWGGAMVVLRSAPSSSVWQQGIFLRQQRVAAGNLSPTALSSPKTARWSCWGGGVVA